MRIVREPGELSEALNSARREALHAFGDSDVFLEQYLERARHIEFQVFGDAHGTVLHLWERECSIQRRHQKIVEEAPSPLLEAYPELRERMGQAAVAAARAVGYQNAGTIEFIVDPASLEFYFLEMNTRLQVEHPVTELLTGLDLVKLQLTVAAGEPLPLTQADIMARGHALECRVYAEDPADEFYPSIGPLHLVVEPHAPGVRVDSGFESGDIVSQHYDALLAKVITHAGTRAEALARMEAALARYVVLGVTTNLAFLRAILAHPEFRAGTATTHFIPEHFAGWRPAAGAPPADALIAAALSDYLGSASRAGAAQAQAAADGAGPASEAEPFSPWAQPDAFRIGGR
jgi:acetyl/propionyl-CoA carboxylase alpha subunit